MRNMEDWLRIGKVRTVNPARRQVRVIPALDRCRFLETAQWVWVRRAGQQLSRCRVESVRRHGAEALVVFSAGVTRDAVAEMTGAELVVPKEEFVRRADAAYCANDLLGMQVVQATDESELGKVTCAYSAGGNEVIEWEAPDGRSVRIPLIEEVVEEVMWDRGVLRVRDITPYAVEDED